MTEKKLCALTDDVVRHIGQGLQARASGFRANGDVERAAHVRSIMDALTPIDTDAAVERMARAILQRVYGGNVDLLGCDAWGVARGDARAALAALLGGEQP